MGATHDISHSQKCHLSINLCINAMFYLLRSFGRKSTSTLLLIPCGFAQRQSVSAGEASASSWRRCRSLPIGCLPPPRTCVFISSCPLRTTYGASNLTASSQASAQTGAQNIQDRTSTRVQGRQRRHLATGPMDAVSGGVSNSIQPFRAVDDGY